MKKKNDDYWLRVKEISDNYRLKANEMVENGVCVNLAEEYTESWSKEKTKAK